MPAPVAARQPEGTGTGWFDEPLAQRLLQEEQRQAIPPLTGCYGATGLYVRPSPSSPAELSGNMLQCVLRLHRESGRLGGDVVCGDAELPVQRESVDLVYLLHALETSDDPRELLLETDRILAPEGNLMLVVLNPYSFWHLRWQGRGLRAIGAGRARNLLREAGFEVVRQYGLGPVWPWLRAQPLVGVPHAGAPDAFSVWRAGYLLQARKRRRGMTPVRPRAGSVSLSPGMHPG